MAAGPTFEPLATTTLGSAAASITFSSISSAYTDLRVVITGSSATAGVIAIQFNSDTGSNYSRTYIYGYGAGQGSGRDSNQTSIVGPNINSTYPSLITMDVFSYAGSTYKTALFAGADDRNGSGTVIDTVGLWRSTSAINAIKIFEANGYNLSAGTTATIYGIKAF